MKIALLIIDIQNDYFPSGRMELVGADEAASQAGSLLDFFRASSAPVIHIQHVSTDEGATFFLPGTDGVNIHPSVFPSYSELIVQKHNVNAYLDTSLLDHLRSDDIERVVICGMMTHMCVDAAVRASADFGLKVVIASDACATRTLTYAKTTVPASHVQAAFLASFRAYGEVRTTEEIISGTRLG